MSTTPILYVLAAVKIDGNVLYEAVKVGIKTGLGRETQKTLQKGVSGFTPGVEAQSITVDSGIPVAGFEVSPAAEIGRSIIHRVDVIFGSRTLTTQGWFVDEDDSQSVGAGAQQAFTMELIPVPFG